MSNQDEMQQIIQRVLEQSEHQGDMVDCETCGNYNHDGL